MNLDDIENLSPQDQEILGLYVALLRQQAQIALHESLLSELLAPRLRGESLQSAYSAEMKQAIQDCLAQIADTDPTKASRIARLLAAADEAGGSP